MAHLARITVYPIKSLDGVDLPEVRVLASGALEWDRRWAFVDSANRVINSKRTPALLSIRAHFDLDEGRITLTWGQMDRTFRLPHDGDGLASWMSDRVEKKVALIEDARAGFPDDTERLGPTLISDATLATVAGWFPGLSRDEAHRRFRANLVLGGCEPFGEDRLLAPPGRAGCFRLGEIEFQNAHPCARCGVPPRDSRTGAVMPEFVRTFAQRRHDSLPPEVERMPFDHFYRLAINTRVSTDQGGRLRLGDALIQEGCGRESHPPLSPESRP